MNNTTPKSMWSSRFVLPQHVDMAHQIHKESIKRKKPTLDDQQLENFSYAIQESILENKEVIVSIFREYGDAKKKGVITKFDQFNRKIKLEYEDTYGWIKLEDITNIELR